ncbi:MAG TPA: hypothetical protein PKI14_19890 [Fervidobacterium sp.]|nr:hypothetical protein [Fervidobacterium sp.]
MNCFECERELTELDTMYEVGDEVYICEDCKDDYYYCCDDCWELVHADDVVAVDYNDRYVC